MPQTLFIKLLAGIFRRIHSKNENEKPSDSHPEKISRVAMVCTGGVGDILMCTPAIRSIKESYPRCRLTVIAHHKRMDVLKLNPFIDELLPLKTRLFHFYKIYKRLKAEPPEFIFLFHINSHYIYCITYLVCLRGLMGYQSNNPFSFLLSKAKPFDAKYHVIQNNLDLVSRIGAKTDNLKMNLYLDESSRGEAKKYLHGSGEPGRYTVGFQLGSGFAGRRWSINRYAELAKLLMKKYDLRILLLGSPKEKALVEELNRALEGKAVPAITDLSTLGEIIKNLDLLITPDTGPMHMAFALERPTVVLSGPTNPKNFGPLVNSARHIQIHKAPPGKTYVKMSEGFEGLMDRITTEEVFEAASSLLEAED